MLHAEAREGMFQSDPLPGLDLRYHPIPLRLSVSDILLDLSAEIRNDHLETLVEGKSFAQSRSDLSVRLTRRDQIAFPLVQPFLLIFLPTLSLADTLALVDLAYSRF